jgi:hypothetical protein
MPSQTPCSGGLAILRLASAAANWRTLCQLAIPGSQQAVRRFSSPPENAQLVILLANITH